MKTNYSTLRSAAASSREQYIPRIPRFLKWLKDIGIEQTIEQICERSRVPQADVVRIVAMCYGTNLLRIRVTKLGTFYSVAEH